MDDIDSIVAKLARIPYELKGCNDTDIEALMNAQGVTFLPETYTKVLRVMGWHGMNDLFDARAEYMDLLKMKAYAKKNFPSEGELAIPDDAFIFSMHQGYSILFFHTKDEKNDPPIFSVADVRKKIADSLTELWMKRLNPDEWLG